MQFSSENDLTNHVNDCDWDCAKPLPEFYQPIAGIREYSTEGSKNHETIKELSALDVEEELIALTKTNTNEMANNTGEANHKAKILTVSEEEARSGKKYVDHGVQTFEIEKKFVDQGVQTNETAVDSTVEMST